MAIHIVGIGCVSAIGTDIDTVWKNLDQENLDSVKCEYECKYEFESYLKGSSKRKTCRQASMCLNTLTKATEDAKQYIEVEKLGETTGTIYSSDFASVEVNINFAKQVIENKPDACSPMTFTNTVANAVLSSLCIPNQYKGVSTMLIESNHLLYAGNLLQEERATHIFTGWVSEYQQDLYDSYKELYQDIKFAEYAVSFLLTNQQVADSYCHFAGHCQMNLLGNPLDGFEEEKEVKACITHNAKTCLARANQNDVDVVITARSLDQLGLIEKEVYTELLPDAVCIDCVEHLFGAVGEGTFDACVMVAALCIKHGRLPSTFTNHANNKKVSTVLVNGYSKTGNYTSLLLSK